MQKSIRVFGIQYNFVEVLQLSIQYLQYFENIIGSYPVSNAAMKKEMQEFSVKMIYLCCLHLQYFHGNFSNLMLFGCFKLYIELIIFPFFAILL